MINQEFISGVREYIDTRFPDAKVHFQLECWPIGAPKSVVKLYLYDHPLERQDGNGWQDPHDSLEAACKTLRQRLDDFKARQAQAVNQAATPRTPHDCLDSLVEAIAEAKKRGLI